MNKFKYRFEVILNKKKREEEQVLKDMSPLLDNLNETQSRIDNFTNNLNELNHSKDEFITSPQNLNYFTGAVDYYRQVVQESKQAKKKVELELAQWREKLRKVMAKRRALEIIREKDLMAFKKVKRRQEQKHIDELVLAKYRTKLKV